MNYEKHYTAKNTKFGKKIPLRVYNLVRADTTKFNRRQIYDRQSFEVSEK